MPYPPVLSITDKQDLAAALLACGCMAELASRNQVLGQLPPQIKHKINRFPNDKQDIVSIIDACLSHGGGIDCLMQIVNFYEEGSIACRELVKVKERLFVRASAELDAVGRALAESSSTGEEFGGQLERAVRAVAQAGSANQRDIYLDGVMHKIDYTEVREFLEEGERRHARDGFAALCLIQESTALGGDWCLKHLRDWLHKEGATPNEVVITPGQSETVDAHFILKRLSAKFAGQHPAEDLNAYTQSVIRKICGSIHLGGRLLIVIRQWEDFADQEATLDWLLYAFWRPLVRAYREGGGRARSRLLVVVVSDLEVAQPDPAGRCCGPEDFDYEKIVRLRLRPWRKKELEDWLIDYWAGPLELDEARVNELVNKMYAASSDGSPELVYRQARVRLLMEAR